ncbi:MAG: M28 family peptidase [Bryobacteraceae bacterium]
MLVLPHPSRADFQGERALEFTRKVVAFGPRPAGSPALRRARRYILSQLRALDCSVEEDRFTAATPRGAVKMTNIIARFPGTSGRAVVVSGHYDTKPMPGIRFVGANDGGSSAGLLLEMARVLSGVPRIHDVYLVWFDGEEAIGPWSETDGIYGSRHLADRWESEKKLEGIEALINVDMIGDRDLGIVQDAGSSRPLRLLVWKVAASLGYGKYFLNSLNAIEDDHMPFVRKGIPALDLIDFDYGPNHSWWHTDKDTMDKLSAQSLEVVGKVLLEVLRQLEKSG